MAVVVALVACGLLLLPAGAAAQGKRKPPVVMLVFDELPGDALLGPDGRIDRGRFPNFAALADSSTWFPNASTVADWTWRAVPAMLTGLWPRKDRAPQTSRDRSLFRLLARNGWAIRGSEEVTSVCDEPGCINGKELTFTDLIRSGRFERMRRSIDAIRPTRKPALWFHDAILPHQPWVFLPSGLRHQAGIGDFNLEVTGPAGFHDPFLAQHAEQRFLLQLGAVDRALGRLISRLRRTGMWDRSLIVVTADHGIAWDVGVKDRRKVSATNVDEVAMIPLFIKAPGQARGGADFSLVRTVDLVPTMASMLGVKVPWRTRGFAVGSPQIARRRRVVLERRDYKGKVSIGVAELALRRARNVFRRVTTFGYGSWDPIYRIGPHPELLGRGVSELPRARAGRLRVQLKSPERFRAVRRSTGIVPASLAGHVEGARPGATRDLAVALGGKVVAMGRTFHLKRRPGERLSVTLPESALQEGRNRLEVFEVRSGRQPKLAPLWPGS